MNCSNTNIKNNQSIFAKVEIVRILLFHFLVDLLPKIVQSPKKISFSTHTQKHLTRFWEKKVKNPARGASLQKSKSKLTYANTLIDGTRKLIFRFWLWLWLWLWKKMSGLLTFKLKWSGLLTFSKSKSSWK